MLEQAKLITDKHFNMNCSKMSINEEQQKEEKEKEKDISH